MSRAGREGRPLCRSSAIFSSSNRMYAFVANALDDSICIKEWKSNNRSLKLRLSSLHFFEGLKDMQSSSFQLPSCAIFLSRVFPLTAKSPSLCIFSETLGSNFAASFSMRLARPRPGDNNAMRDHTGVRRSTAKSKVWWDSAENNIYTMVITNI